MVIGITPFPCQGGQEEQLNANRNNAVYWPDEASAAKHGISFSAEF